MKSANDIVTLPSTEADARPLKPLLSEYGYLDEKGTVHPCTRATLIAKVGGLNLGQPKPQFVWTPEVETLVEAYEIPYLFAPFKQRLRRLSILKLIGGGITLAACALLLQRFPYGLLFLPLLFVAIPAFLYLWDGLQTLFRLKNLQPEALAQPVPPTLAPEDIERIVHLQTLKLTWTKEIMACLLTVGILQLFAPNGGIYTAGLVKPAVWQGEVWRLVTAGM
ncbi:MAG TPA: hypothetical protein VFZ34_06245, partial [Blastocatellia bacterium]|nr:hypothetical protein [Blastocatellia bacterium]